MDSRTFKQHLERKGYLMNDLSCYVPGNYSDCSGNRWERILTPDCKKCLERFDRLEGEPIPEELHPKKCNENTRFIMWKVMQKIAVRRASGEYTEEQAKIVKEEYIKLSTPKPKATSDREKQRILSKIFS